MKHPSITSTDRFLLISFVLCVTGSLLIYQQIDRHYTKSNLVTHSYIIKVTLNQFLLNLTEAETNQRGYLLTHDSDFLTSYQRAIQKARFIVGILDSLTLDDPGQQESLFKLRQAFNNSMLTLQASMLLPSAPTTGPGGGGQPATDDLADGIIQHTKDILDNLRSTAYTMLDAEDALLRNRIIARNNLTRRNPYYMLTTGLLVTALIVFVYLKLKKETLLRLDSEHNTAELEKKDIQRSKELAGLEAKAENNTSLEIIL